MVLGLHHYVVLQWGSGSEMRCVDKFPHQDLLHASMYEVLQIYS